MNELIVVAKAFAAVSSVAGLVFTIKQDWYKSSIAWNATAAILWLTSFAA